ncbi:hypothetical protein ACFOEE_00255 [Pseudoalteromonas fenneropenaei]|uniref:Uncharacterized protein n=1 Tax=Pseudoalteromonas fenneropenaei TaxID=1737459 RepID=A0ABV7CEV8_9GAMM
MELVKRYVAAVQRELPEDKRQEIGRELEANILDKLDALAEQGEVGEQQISDVLVALGHPSAVAKQFVPPKPFISSDYLEAYQYTLYMVLGVLFVLQVFGTTTHWFNSEMGPIRYVLSLLTGFLDEACFAFTSVTLAYALISHQQPQKQQQARSWSPMQLPSLASTWQHIKLQDIFTDLATYTFVLVVIWYPEFVTQEQLATVYIRLSDQAQTLLLWCSPLFIAGIMLNLWQLQARYWQTRMQLCNLVINSGLVVALLYLAANGPLLYINTEAWPHVMGWEQLQNSARWSSLVIACFPAYEIVRDIRRLWLKS